MHTYEDLDYDLDSLPSARPGGLSPGRVLLIVIGTLLGVLVVAGLLMATFIGAYKQDQEDGALAAQSALSQVANTIEEESNGATDFYSVQEGEALELQMDGRAESVVSLSPGTQVSIIGEDGEYRAAAKHSYSTGCFIYDSHTEETQEVEKTDRDCMRIMSASAPQ